MCLSPLEALELGLVCLQGGGWPTWLGAQLADMSDTTVGDFSAPVC